MSKICKSRSSLTTYIALSGALLFSVILTMYNVGNLGYAQEEQQQQETFFESGIRTANETSTSTASQGIQSQPQEQEATDGFTLVTGKKPLIGKNFVWSGLISSNIDELPLPDEDRQSAVILPLRDDGGLYSGTLVFQSNSPVEVTVWNEVAPTNDTSTVEEFSDMEDIGVVKGMTITPTEITSGTSGSVPFIGNALELIGDEEPFISTYALNAVAAQPTNVSDLISFRNLTTIVEVEEQEDN
jgi:hypothetical protein